MRFLYKPYYGYSNVVAMKYCFMIAEGIQVYSDDADTVVGLFLILSFCQIGQSANSM